MNYRLLFVFFIVLSLVSCRSKKNVLYFQNSDNVSGQSYTDYELKIQTDDLLRIEVLAIDAETVKVFNNGYLNNGTNSGAANGGANSGGSTGANTDQNTYLVDSYGYIEFPVLGRLKVSNLTKSELIGLLKEKLSTYVSNPIIRVRLLNFKVTVIGQPGGGVKTVTFDTEKVSLPQFLSDIGDLSIPYSSKKNILILREVDGVKTINRIDMTQADIITSPFYYLAQNDVVYIEPTKQKMNANAIPTVLVNTATLLGITVSIVAILASFK